ncbi:MAG: metallophosphoesterase family protein [Syntrophobacteraceae bacterium]
MNKIIAPKKLLGILIALAVMIAFFSSSATASNKKLRFRPDGTFKIVQFTDTQDDQDIDPRTVELIEKVLDTENPDLVVFTGDNIAGGPGNGGIRTLEDLQKAIDNIAAPVDSRHIPWLITFGNHDAERAAITNVDEPGMLKIYRSYPYNINQVGPKGVNGTGNMNALIYNSTGRLPVFNIWALDSGRYAPDSIAGQNISNDALLGWGWMPTWDWLQQSQVQWYATTSQGLEKSYGRKIPSLMFFHIPLQEFRQMYENGSNHDVTGERNEDECPGPFNSGMFAALLERKDVRGVFVGHDHVNDYVGNYFGIMLGYSASTGFGTYGLGGDDNHRMRGARVFSIYYEDNPQIDTHMVFAKDLGISIVAATAEERAPLIGSGPRANK